MSFGYRSHSTLINEAKLLVSSPEVVAAWLAELGNDSPWGGMADDLLELNLLNREDRLIDLALAEYALSTVVLRDLFERKDEIIRAAVLCNQRVHKMSLGVNYWTFASDKFDFSWMAALSNVEAEALFANPSLPDHFVADFFEQKGVWNDLNDDQRIAAASNIIETLHKRQSRDEFTDGWAHYSHSNVFNAAWKFSGVAPVNRTWAYLLQRLYSTLVPEVFSKFDPIQTAERWRERDEEYKEYNEYGNLGDFQGVRCGLARLAAHKSSGLSGARESILSNEDVAIRCGGYLVFGFSVDEIKAATELDTKLACRHLIRNENVWKNADLRWTLDRACQKESKGDDYIVSLRREFGEQEDKMRILRPDWFYDDDPTVYREDKLLSESKIGELFEFIVGSSHFNSVKSSIAAKEKNDIIRFWILLIVLSFVLYRL